MKASAKLPNICIGGRGKGHKFKTQRHKITRFPRHDMCLPCLQSGVYLVSGRYRSDGPYLVQFAGSRKRALRTALGPWVRVKRIRTRPWRA
jgi:hypothetical protein